MHTNFANACLSVRATLTEGYRRSHFGPPLPDGPDASMGDYCSAVISTSVATNANTAHDPFIFLSITLIFRLGFAGSAGSCALFR